MTPEEIRAEAIERIARADYTAWLERVRDVSDRWDEPCEHLPWDDAPDEGEWGRDHWRRISAPKVDALGDLLPVDVEYGTDLGGDSMDSVLFGCTEEDARKMSNPVRRFVGGWMPMEGDGLW